VFFVCWRAVFRVQGGVEYRELEWVQAWGLAGLKSGICRPSFRRAKRTSNDIIGDNRVLFIIILVVEYRSRSVSSSFIERKARLSRERICGRGPTGESAISWFGGSNPWPPTIAPFELRDSSGRGVVTHCLREDCAELVRLLSPANVGRVFRFGKLLEKLKGDV
jgi:hypothetical protein